MSLEAALISRVLGVPGIAAKVGNRVKWSLRLAGLPAITMQTVADPRPQHYKGFQSSRPTNVQVDVWSGSEEEAAALRELLIVHLTPAATVGTVRFQRAMVLNVRGGAEPEQSVQGQRPRSELYRESIDFTFTHNA